ncbi:BZ3500_MvSof-1268-A1-R1_Chr1-1g00854 [Microbotryum saponariae]|uniref:BZ3500_MvSof-1268-A1-R1_Chr1-1g00854 protein n=1 Tax=Microbotryum saponariae TaxID=289078 RepID=A0A2X0KDZ6_9BASI|nr:BZ3500_MvSof-1268-A1-R1_Chr1-1g00854 [Microbotryum saponariae]SCZ92784.1 BZ3501_MvSof-1269-A2-R1_Chr1-1g00451 [Microbotryum saponariae]
MGGTRKACWIYPRDGRGEYDARSLTDSCVLQFDNGIDGSHHVFYVEWDPPRSIWVHPFAPDFLNKVCGSERTRLFGDPSQDFEIGLNDNENSTHKVTSSIHEGPEALRLKRSEYTDRLYVEYKTAKEVLSEDLKEGRYEQRFEPPEDGEKGVEMGWGPYGFGVVVKRNTALMSK